MIKFASATIAALALTLAAPQLASAAPTNTPVTVTQLVVYADGHFDVNFSAAVCNDAGASLPMWAHAALSSSATADGLKDMLSVLLASKLSGKSVKINTSGASGMCVLAGVNLS
jgi:hypothetical protein